MGELDGLRLIVGVTGSIAAYKVPGLIRLLRKEGAVIEVILTPGGEQFITELTLETVSGRQVHRAMFGERRSAALTHVELADSCNAVIVAPATANLLAKAATGMADDLLTTVLLAAGHRVPVIYAPAMNVHLWESPLTQRNVAILRRQGHHFVGPAEGPLAEGYSGAGRMLEPDVIAATVLRILTAAATT